MAEILKSNFDEIEYKKVEDKIAEDSSLNEVYKKIKDDPSYRLSKLEESIERTESNFMERFDAFKKAVLDAEKKQSIPTSIEEVTSLLNNKKDEVIDNVEKSFLDKIGLSSILEKFTGVFDKISEKISSFFSWDKIIASVLGVFGISSAVVGDKEEGQEENKGDKRSEITIEEPEVITEKDGKINEGDIKFYYMSGISSLTHLAGNNLDFHETNKASFKKFKHKTFGDLKEIKVSGGIKGKDITFEDKKVLDSILGDDSIVLLKSSLKKEIVLKTLNDNKIKLEGLMGAEYSKILNSLKKGEFNIDNLSLKAISILFLFSINSFGLLSIDAVKGSLSGVQEYFTSTSINVDKIIFDIESKKNGLVSKGLIGEFSSKYNLTKGWGGKDDVELLENFEGSENIEELKKLIDFKKWLISDDFVGEKSKTLLGLTDQKDIFIENLDYIGIISLYIILGGKKSLDNMNIIDLPVLYKTVSFILSRKNPAQGSSYLVEVMKYFSLGNNESNDIFKDDNDKEALNIIIKRLGKDYLGVVYREIKGTLGYVGLFKDDYQNDAIALFSGYLGSKLGSKMMNKGFVFQGALLKKFAYIAIFSGIASGIHTTYNNGSEMFNVLRGFGKDFDLSTMDNDQLDSFINDEVRFNTFVDSLENFNDRLIPKEVDIDGKKEKVLLYIGDGGLEIIYNNSVYKLGTGFSRFGDIKNTIKNISGILGEYTSGFFNYIKNEVPGDTASIINEYQSGIDEWSKNKTSEFKGKEYDFTDVKIVGDMVIIKGNPNLEYNLEYLLKKFIKEPLLHPEKSIGSEDALHITYKLIDEGNNEGDNIILLKQGEIKI